MATTDAADGYTLQIAGLGHVYYGEPSTTEPPSATDMEDYQFGNGSTLAEAGWTWLGDTSAENTIEFETDGGETTTKNTWDRQGVRATREAVTETMTIHAVGIGKDVLEIAFPGSSLDQESGWWNISTSGSSEKAILIVIEEGTTVSAWYFPKVSIAGSMPTLSTEEFTEIPLTGTLLGSDVSGEKCKFLPAVTR